LALLGLLSGAIYTWCPTQENRQRINVPPRPLRSVAALLAKYRSLPEFARRLELGISLRRCLSTGAALLVVGSLYGSYVYAYRLGQRNTRNMETKHDTVPILHDTDSKLQSQLGADSAVPRYGGERETLPLRSNLSAEVQRERDLYIRGLHCLNDND